MHPDQALSKKNLAWNVIYPIHGRHYVHTADSTDNEVFTYTVTETPQEMSLLEQR